MNLSRGSNFPGAAQHVKDSLDGKVSSAGRNREEQMASAEQWLTKLANLKVDKARGAPAPHKPLLLLVVFELAEQSQSFGDILPLTPELAFRFCTYWSIVAHRRTQAPDVRYPFFHLKTDGFWSPLAEDGKPALDRRLTRYAALPLDFVAFAKDPAYRDKGRRILIAKYFQPQERVALYTLVGLPIPSDDQIAQDAAYKSPEEASKQGREARFRLNIVAAYDYTCALTRYRLTTISGGSIVDAAHIHQFSDSRNNDPRNGLALCKNAHWLFDNGLWTLSDEYKVIVAEGRFAEAGPHQQLLREFHGKPILLPSDPAIWPNLVHMAWHRKHRFQGA
jgi:putative restriction endonuclease